MYGKVEYEITIEKKVEEEIPFTKNEILKMNKLGVTVALDGEGYQQEQKVTKDMKPQDLINVKLLDLHDINLQIIPSWLSRFHNLRYLNLSNTNIDIQEFKKLLNKGSFDKLDVLILSNNDLFKNNKESFNNLAKRLPALNSIDLSHTGGTSLNYNGLYKIKNLQILNLSHNKINEDFKVLKLNKLKKLKELDLSFNTLKTIDLNLLPKTIIWVNLSNNNLKELKASEFQYLEELNLANNPALKNNQKLCGEFVLPDISVIRGNNMCKYKRKIENTNYIIRLGLFTERVNAEKVLEEILKEKFSAFIINRTINGKLYNSVEIGFYEKKEKANELKKSLPKPYIQNSIVYPIDYIENTEYVIRFGLFNNINDKVKKLHNNLLAKKFPAFIIKRQINNRDFYGVEVGFFSNIYDAKIKKKEILSNFPKGYLGEIPKVYKIE